MFYLARYVRDEDRMSTLAALAAKDIGALPGTPARRLSFKLSASANEMMQTVMEQTALTRTELTKALIARIGEELVEPREPRHLDQLSLLAQVIKA